MCFFFFFLSKRLKWGFLSKWVIEGMLSEKNKRQRKSRQDRGRCSIRRESPLECSLILMTEEGRFPSTPPCSPTHANSWLGGGWGVGMPPSPPPALSPPWVIQQSRAIYRREQAPQHMFSRTVMSDAVISWTAACQVSLFFTVSWSLLEFMSIESVMLSNHFILCCPLLFSSIIPSIRVFSNELAFHIRWPKY